VETPFRPAVDLLHEAIAARATPGAVLLAGSSREILLEQACGRLTYTDDAPPVTPSTIYDLASLTKVLVTTPLAMLLWERGLLDLKSPVCNQLPEFSGGGKEQVRIQDLLAHCGGLLWWTELYKQCEGLSAAEAKRSYLQAICELPLDYPPRTKAVYSDLGFLLLGEILERVAGTSLDALAAQEIFAPLGMDETCYRPPVALRPRIAPTEHDAWRGRVVHGEVHDENAFGLDGVAPHAGLFSTARSLAPFARVFLNQGTHGGQRRLSPETIRLFTTRANLVPGSSRTLGWDTPGEGSSAGRCLSPSAFGHTGFTGTSLWIDPERDLFVVLLTNRVHPTRDNPAIADLRPALHDAVARATSA